MNPDTRSIGPARRALAALSDVDTVRVRQLVTRTSVGGAAIILGVTESTLAGARAYGTMEPKTHRKIVTVLDIVDSWGRS